MKTPVGENVVGAFSLQALRAPLQVPCHSLRLVRNIYSSTTTQLTPHYFLSVLRYYSGSHGLYHHD